MTERHDDVETAADADRAEPTPPPADASAPEASPEGSGEGPAAARWSARARGVSLSPTLRRRMAVVLGVLLVVSAVAAAFFAWNLREVESELDTRAEVARVAEQFTAEVNNYDSASVEEYQASVSEKLSTKFRAEFEKAMADIVRSVREAEMDSQGTVLASGVASLDQDSARVLVVADAKVTTVADTRARHFRWEVSLVKVDDEWLVDDFTPVA